MSPPRVRPSLLVVAALAACSRPPSQPQPQPPVRDMPADPPRISITGDPELVARGIVSSQYTEIRLAASPDGRLLLWGSTDRPGPGGWNIWMARRTQGGWSQPQPAPFNSDANDFDPAFAGDGRLVYFFSNRPGGHGGDDIYRVPVTGDGFGPVEHLGPEINTPGDEWAPSPSPDGSQLMFASNVPKAKHDLFVARTRGAGFARARPLPGAVNTPGADEFDATFLADGSSIVFSRSNDVENEEIRLYYSAPGPRGYDAGTELPHGINLAGGAALGPTIDPRDPQSLYFSSKRPEASAGKLDIYRVRYALPRRRR